MKGFDHAAHIRDAASRNDELDPDMIGRHRWFAKAGLQLGILLHGPLADERHVLFAVAMGPARFGQRHPPDQAVVHGFASLGLEHGQHRQQAQPLLLGQFGSGGSTAQIVWLPVEMDRVA